MDPTADNNLFFADFDTPATIKEAGKTDRPVSILYSATSFNELGVVTDKPEAVLQGADLAGFDLKAATLTVGAEVFHMIRPMSDGLGLITVGLKR